MTENERDRILRNRELGFFGAVTASISHDLNNAMAIIDQTAGLLDDLIAGSGDEGVVKTKQLQRIVDKIERQTKRGADIIRRMNTFAHSVDDPVKDLELGQLAGDVIALAKRMAERRRVQLEAVPAQAAVPIKANAFQAQQAVYLSIEQLVAIVPEGDTISLTACTNDSEACVDAQGAAGDSSQGIDLTYLEILMEELGGSVDSTTENGRATIRLTFRRSSQ
jgi:signal transduction histidine kinase